METEKYEEAVRDHEKVCKIDRSRGKNIKLYISRIKNPLNALNVLCLICLLSPSEYRRMLEEAKLELKKSKRKDYYKILGIAKGATEDEIKKAYKKEALKHHPG